jgi:hypothetical protein
VVGALAVALGLFTGPGDRVASRPPSPRPGLSLPQTGWFRDTLPTAPIDRLAVLRLDGGIYGQRPHVGET